jgi:hypothetical protein
MLVLGGLTVVSATVFRSLRSGDGDSVSRPVTQIAVSPRRVASASTVVFLVK